jgi:hypothetical protein
VNKLAKVILPELTGKTTGTHDGSTAGLIGHLREG